MREIVGFLLFYFGETEAVRNEELGMVVAAHKIIKRREYE